MMNSKKPTTLITKNLKELCNDDLAKEYII